MTILFRMGITCDAENIVNIEWKPLGRSKALKELISINLRTFDPLSGSRPYPTR
jgi:hypothetical protein